MRLRVSGLMYASRESSEMTRTAGSERAKRQNLVEQFRRHLTRIQHRARIVEDEVADRIEMRADSNRETNPVAAGSWRGRRQRPPLPRCRNDSKALRYSTGRFHREHGCRKRARVASHIGLEPARTESPGAALRSAIVDLNGSRAAAVSSVAGQGGLPKEKCIEPGSDQTSP